MYHKLTMLYLFIQKDGRKDRAAVDRVFFLRILRILGIMVPRFFCIEVRHQTAVRLVLFHHVLCISIILQDVKNNFKFYTQLKKENKTDWKDPSSRKMLFGMIEAGLIKIQESVICVSCFVWQASDRLLCRHTVNTHNSNYWFCILFKVFFSQYVIA